jgi:hypothetical protein
MVGNASRHKTLRLMASWVSCMSKGGVPFASIPDVNAARKRLHTNFA